ncbi:MAG TPA: ABC transporter permease [Gemmatimonadaceae bacterium]
MGTIRSDFRMARRALASQRGVTAVAIATLALTIGLNTAVFSIVNAVVLRPLPFAQPDRLVAFCEADRGEQSDWCGASVPDVYELAERVPGIAVAGAARSWPFVMKTPEGVDGIRGGLVTPEAFAALRVVPMMGRFIEREDMGDNWRRVVVLSNDFWRARYGSRTDVLGQQVVLDDEPHTIVGVLPPDVRVPHLEDVQMWRPIHFDPHAEDRRDWRGFLAFARLRDGVNPDAVRRDVANVGADIQRAHFSDREGWSIGMRSWQDVIVGPVRTTMYLFVGAVGFVLLIGCANVANLLLAQAVVRRRELAVRAALGASRFHLARGLLVESLLLAVAGGAAGLFLGWWASRLVVTMAPQGIPRIDKVGLDPAVFAYIAGISLLATLLVGMAPAIRATRFDLQRALAEGGRTGTAHHTARLAPALIITQIALAVVLVTGAGLLTRSFVTLMRWQPGFEQEHLLTTWALASSGQFENRRQVADYFARAEEELRSIPGVVAVGAGSAGPLFGGDGEGHLTIDGRGSPGDGARQAAYWFDISPTYFAALGVPIVRGRDIAATDVVGAPTVAVVNEAFVRRYIGDADPVGRVVRMVEHETDFTIVGVVRDVPPVSPGEPAPPQIFWSNRQLPRPATYFLVRTSGDPVSTGRAVQERLRSFDRDLRVTAVRSMRDWLSTQLARPRFSALLLGTFGVLALLLSAIGTYGLISYTVAQQRKEIGVRMALGAQGRRIVAEVLVRGLRLAGIGVAVGVAGSLALTRLLSNQLAGVTATDPLTFAMSVGLLLIAAALACVVPARRASRVDPMETLRSE